MFCYPFTHWWIFGLPLPFDYCKYAAVNMDVQVCALYLLMPVMMLEQRPHFTGGKTDAQRSDLPARWCCNMKPYLLSPHLHCWVQFNPCVGSTQHQTSVRPATVLQDDLLHHHLWHVFLSVGLSEPGENPVIDTQRAGISDAPLSACREEWSSQGM